MKKITSKLTSKYQLTFPKTIRNYLNINDFDFVDFIIDDDGRVIVEKGILNINVLYAKMELFLFTHVKYAMAKDLSMKFQKNY